MRGHCFADASVLVRGYALAGAGVDPLNLDRRLLFHVLVNKAREQRHADLVSARIYHGSLVYSQFLNTILQPGLFDLGQAFGPGIVLGQGQEIYPLGRQLLDSPKIDLMVAPAHLPVAPQDGSGYAGAWLLQLLAFYVASTSFRRQL